MTVLATVLAEPDDSTIAAKTSSISATSNARDAEMMLHIWVRLFGVIKSPTFSFKLVR